MNKSLISEANDDKAKNIKADDIVKTFKLFKPDQAITFLAKQYDMKPSEFFAKKFLKIAAYSIKNGLVKTGDIAKSVKDFTKKNIKDNTDIDYDNLEIDPDTVKIKTLFGGKDNKVLVDFINEFSEEMKDIDSEVEKQTQQLKNDIKKRGVSVSDEQISKNGPIIVGTIYNKENKDLSKKELRSKIDSDIKEYEELNASQELVTKALNKKIKEFAKKQANKAKKKKKTKNNKTKTRKTKTKKYSKKTRTKFNNKQSKQIKKESITSIPILVLNEERNKEYIPRKIVKQKSENTYIGQGIEPDDEATRAAGIAASRRELSIDRQVELQLIDNLEADPELGEDIKNMIDYTNIVNMSHSRIQLRKNTEYIDALRISLDNLKHKLGVEDLSPEQLKEMMDIDTLGDAYEEMENDQLLKMMIEAEKTLDKCEKLIGYDGPEPLYGVVGANETEDIANSASVDFDDSDIQGLGSPGSSGSSNIQDQLPDEAQPKQKKSGLFNGTLGWAIVGAKVTGFVLNHGKGVIDAFGNQAVKFKEDRGVVAQMTFLATNSEKSDSKFQDSKFSVRFNVDDLKWHATNLDNRKMMFEEDKVINLALNSEEGKKFKKNTINRWRRLFRGKGKNGKTIFTYILNHASQFKLDKDKKLLATLSKMNSNFDKIEQQFA